MRLIQSFLERCRERRPRIGVVGDSMIDDYFRVKAERVSPEFPFPVLSSDHDRPVYSLPGGAANVCRQLSGMDADASLVSPLNREAVTVLAGRGLNLDRCLVSPSTQVPIKKRYYQGDLPLARHDIEAPDFGLGPEVSRLQQDLLGNYLQSGSIDEVLILSDYHKGVFTTPESRRSWTSLGIPTIVDPKRGPADSWRGCTVFKPNAAEALALSGLTEWQDQVEFFRRVLECDNIVITQGGDGVVGFDGTLGETFEFRSPRGVVARSVVGAGDCFIGFLALAFAHGFPVWQGARVAFEAGSVYVTNSPNRPITGYDLLRGTDPHAAKYSRPEVQPGERLVLANGVFDILHANHVQMLRFARDCGDRLLVALNGDGSTRRLKGPARPIIPLKERMEIIASLECVDFVCSFDEDTPIEVVRRCRPTFIVKGGDYLKEEVAGHDLVEDVILFKYDHSQSTTKIVESCRGKD